MTTLVSGLAQIPFAVSLLSILYGLTHLTNTFSKRLSGKWLKRFGMAPRDIWYWRVEKIIACALVTHGRKAFWRAVVMVAVVAILLLQRREKFYRADCPNCGTVNPLAAENCHRCKRKILLIDTQTWRLSLAVTLTVVCALINFILVLNWCLRWMLVVTAGIKAEFFLYLSLEALMIITQWGSVLLLLILSWRLIKIPTVVPMNTRRIPAMTMVAMLLILLVYGKRLMTEPARDQLRLAALYNLEVRSTIERRIYVKELRERIRRELKIREGDTI